MGRKVIMVSACLLGINCRYDAKAKPIANLAELFPGYQLRSFCPEVLGGLKIPRPPAEIQNGTGWAVLNGEAKIFNRDGQECTAAFINGAMMSLEEARRVGPSFIIAKANSPSCGVGTIYDGSFSGRLIAGDGVTVAILRDAGFKVYSEYDLPAISVQILAENEG